MQRHFISRTSYFLNATTTHHISKSSSRLQYGTINTLAGFKRAHQFHTGQPMKSSITKSLPIKTISTLAAVSLAYYHYAPKMNEKLVVEIASAPISAFSTSTSAGTIHELLDDENRAAMKAKTTQELLLGLFVYKLCTLPWIVDAAPHLIKLAETLHLQAPVYWFVKNTFFSQFCGGETAEECVATMTRLSQSGINCILDLSVEADLHLDELSSKQKKEGKYWLQEQKADVILEMIKNCIKTAASGQHEEYATSGAFAAVKVTAFAPPELLLRLNQVMLYLDQAFEMYQVQGHVDSACLDHVITKLCPAPQSELQQNQRTQIVSHLKQNQGTLDYAEFSQLFNLRGAGRKVWWETDVDTKTEEQVFLTHEDLEAYDRMVNRLEQVCQLAHEVRVGIMIDAEQSYFQEAIDHVAMNLQEKFNRRDDTDHSPTVYNTCK